jgi:NifU-like protein involved in Fe-S cluster formation
MTADKILDYDKLVDAYSANLDVTLRGFRPAEEMLDTWVPDEDPVRSLTSLVEAAQLCGSDAVAIRVSNKTLDGHSSDSLKEKLGSLGEVAMASETDAIVLTISNLQDTATFRSVRPIYQQKLRDRFVNLRFQRALKVEGNQIPLRAAEDHFSLECAVQTDKHVISDAVFESKSRGPMMAALDCLCEILVGLPIQEARDHAVIKLEFSLRDPKQPHPVSGIVLPHNADPLFRLPSRLINRIFEDYKTSTQYQPSPNFYDPGPKPSWAALSPADREQRVTAAIVSHGAPLGLHNGEVKVVECKFPYAVTIRFDDELAISTKRKIAFDVERLVREHCDPRLEVFCEEKKDMSKLRRQIEHLEKENQ